MGLMSLFRREPASGETPKAKRRGSAADHEATVQRLRQQARRRLLGAAVLVGMGIVAFPIVFETQPRPVPMDLPIVIPAQSASPKPLATSELPARLPEAAARQPVAPVETVEPDPATEPVGQEAPASAPADRSVERAKPEAPKRETPKPAAALPSPATTPAAAAKPAPAEAARFVVQVGAFADQQAAQNARRKLEAKGLKTYAQVAKTKDGDRIRVRLGPFADRAEADKAAAKAKAAGLAGAVLTL